jgi:hypothetical protein
VTADNPAFVVGRGFQKKFPTLGDTKGLRVPYCIHRHMDTISQELEAIASRHDIDYVLHILDKVIEGLESVP